MALVVVEAGETVLLGLIGSNINNYKVGLYKNDRTPSATDVLADYTAADFSGYSGAMILDTMSSPIQSGGKAVIQCLTSKQWSHDGGGTANTIYGYYVTNNGETTLYWAERFDSAVLMDDATDSIIITPMLTLASEN